MRINGEAKNSNINLALERVLGSRFWGHLWAESAWLGVGWMKRNRKICGMWASSVLSPDLKTEETSVS